MNHPKASLNWQRFNPPILGTLVRFRISDMADRAIDTWRQSAFDDATGIDRVGESFNPKKPIRWSFSIKTQ